MSVNGQPASAPTEASPESTPSAGQNPAGENAAGQAGAALPRLRAAVVVGGNRIPFARTGGAYAKSSNQDMLTPATST
jgi:acetyl-CoA C-acetyltransferase